MTWGFFKKNTKYDNNVWTSDWQLHVLGTKIDFNEEKTKPYSGEKTDLALSVA